MAQQYLTKMQAIAAIGVETGYGRRVIEQKLDELVTAGKVALEPDPIYKRQFRISRADVDIVVKALKEAGGQV
jgi:hypothetical protein